MATLVNNTHAVQTWLEINRYRNHFKRPKRKKN